MNRPRAWWQVMCLTGLDYFSTLGYQPAIAVAAAGLISPFATLVLVALTLLGALPVYRRVAARSYRGSGSIAMLEHLLPGWAGKLFVLVLLGFAATDFIITITLSAADASAHLLQNPLVPRSLSGAQLITTLAMIGLLAGVFLRGFREAITIAVPIVGIYLMLNVVVIAVTAAHAFGGGDLVGAWWRALTATHDNPLLIAGVALLVFPKLALGMSGFETGVAVMPQIRSTVTDPNTVPADRIRGAHRLLTMAALTMSVLLTASSVLCVVLIPLDEFGPGGAANGRALAFLAHRYLGAAFGTAYDLSTILILWFAGASAMAGLLNLVPRYLPRYGMAPQWARAVRPLVFIVAAVAGAITLIFDADVDAQGGAYATGVLVLITSAAIAVTLSARHHADRRATAYFAVVSVVFFYTTVVNVAERPDGLRIGTVFILAILVTSLVSRVRRSFELRATSVTFDDVALHWLRRAAGQNTIRLIAHDPRTGRNRREYRMKAASVAMPAPPLKALFLEVELADVSEFEEALAVRAVAEGGYCILSVRSANVPNTIAAVALAIRDRTRLVPHIYFQWNESSPLRNVVHYLFAGTGEDAAVTREVLRRAEPDPARRPIVHVT